MRLRARDARRQGLHKCQGSMCAAVLKNVQCSGALASCSMVCAARLAAGHTTRHPDRLRDSLKCGLSSAARSRLIRWSAPPGAPPQHACRAAPPAHPATGRRPPTLPSPAAPPPRPIACRPDAWCAIVHWVWRAWQAGSMLSTTLILSRAQAHPGSMRAAAASAHLAAAGCAPSRQPRW